MIDKLTKEKWEDTPCPICNSTRWSEVPHTNLKLDVNAKIVSLSYGNCGYFLFYVDPDDLQAALYRKLKSG